MPPESLLSNLLARAEQVIVLFVVVCLAAAGVMTFDPRAQAGLPYFLGAVGFGLACGCIAIAFGLGEGWVLIVGVAAMATAPATIAALANKRLDEVIDEIRRRGPGGGGGRDGEGG
jgi:hypothetical protein